MATTVADRPTQNGMDRNTTAGTETELWRLSATDLAHLIRTRKVSAREAAQAAPGFHIPQANRVFLATRSQKLPIGAEGDGEDRILAAYDTPQFVPACGIPKLDGTIAVSRS